MQYLLLQVHVSPTVHPGFLLLEYQRAHSHPRVSFFRKWTLFNFLKVKLLSVSVSTLPTQCRSPSPRIFSYMISWHDTSHISNPHISMCCTDRGRQERMNGTKTTQSFCLRPPQKSEFSGAPFDLWRGPFSLSFVFQPLLTVPFGKLQLADQKTAS